MAPEGFIVKSEPGNVSIGSCGKDGRYPAMSREHAQIIAEGEVGIGKTTVLVESLGDVLYVDGGSDSKVASKS